MNRQEDSKEVPHEVAQFYELFENALSGAPYRYENERALDAIQPLAQQVLGNDLSHWGTIDAIQGIIATLGYKLNEQINEILHHSDFQRLEGTWRGIAYLVKSVNESKNIELTILNVSKRELYQDLRRGYEDHINSTIRSRLLTERIGTLGGTPCSFIVGDYYFSQSRHDVDLLRLLARLGFEACAPFIASVSPQLFGFGSFSQTLAVNDIRARFNNIDGYVSWNAMRDSWYNTLKSTGLFPEASSNLLTSRFVVLTTPRALARGVYGRNGEIVEEFDFEEEIRDDESDLCWMNTAYLFGAIINRAYRNYGEFTSIENISGRVIEGLPAYVSSYDDFIPNQMGPTEAPITDEREAELSDIGLVALIRREDRDDVAFSRPVVFARPPTDAEGNKTPLYVTSILSSSRLMHQILRIVREREFRSREDCEDWLNRWIAGFVTKAPGPEGQPARGLYLRSGNVGISTTKYHSPGEYGLVAKIEPWSGLGGSPGPVVLIYPDLSRMHWVVSHTRSVGAHGVARLAGSDHGSLVSGLTYVLDVFVTGSPFRESTRNQEHASAVTDFLEYQIGVRSDGIEIRPNQICTFIWQNSVPHSSIQFLVRPLRPGRQIIFVDYYLQNHWLTTVELSVEAS